MSTAAAGTATGRLNPFPGLRPFREEEAHLFFGREGQVSELLRRLEKSRSVAVVGTSGSGKSSLVFAGLLPALHAGAIDRVAAWRVAKMRPGNDPLGELARALADEDALGGVDGIAGALETSSFGLIEVTRRAGLRSDERLLVVVDQFEEIFRFKREAAGGAERAASFVELLLRASAEDETPVDVLLTMRSDFLGECAQFRGLPEAMNESQFLVPRMTRDERRDAIEGPMLVRGQQIAPRLVERLLNDAGDDPNQLPVLQHALMRTVEVWLESKEPRPVDLADYEDKRIGSMRGALDRHANEVLEELTDVPQPVAIRMFQRLTERRAGARDTRRPTKAGELSDVTGAALETIRKVYRHFSQEGRTFLTCAQQEPGPESVIDITHESLIRLWRDLDKWTDEESARAQEYRRLVQAARLRSERSERGKRQAELWRGKDLARAEGWEQGLLAPALGDKMLAVRMWARRYREPGDETDRGFEEAVAFLKESRWGETRRRWLKRAGFAAVCLIAVTFAVLTWWARRQTKEAERQHILGVWQSAARQAAADAASHADDDRTVLLAVEAMRLHAQTPDKPRYLIEDVLQAALYSTPFSHVLRGHQGAVSSVAFSADGNRLSSGCVDGKVRVWDVHAPNAPPLVLSGHEDVVLSVAFAPGGDRLAAGGEDGTVRIWELRRPNAPAEVFRYGYVVNSLAFAPNGSRLAAGSGGGHVSVWDLGRRNAPEMVLDGHQGAVNPVAFAADSNSLASAGEDGTVQVWDLSGPYPRGHALYGKYGVLSVSFAPDGSRLAAAGFDDKVRVWDVHRLDASPQILSGHDGAVSGVVFAADGKRIASASADRTVRVWDLGRPKTPAQVLSGHQDYVNAVAFAPDGNRIASASRDQTVRVWDLRQKNSPPKVISTDVIQVSVAFSPDGKRLAWGGHDQKVRVRDVDQPDAAGQLLVGHRKAVTFVAFAPNGKRLASASLDATVRVWDLRQNNSPPQVLSHNEAVYSVAFAPDGQRLASASLDGTVRVWELHRPQTALQVLSGHNGGAYSVAFAPDGNHLASGAEDRMVRVWDLSRGGATPQILSGHTGGVLFVAFAPDGYYLASGGIDTTVRVWDMRRPNTAPQVLVRNQGPVLSAAFSPNGDQLASSFRTSSVLVWNVRQPNAAPQVLPGNPYGARSVAFSPDGNHIAAGGNDGKVWIWPRWSAAADHLCGRAWRNLSMQEWQFYIGEGIPYERTCPNLPAGFGAPGGPQ